MGTYTCMKYAIRQMTSQGTGGRIVNVSSAGAQKGIPGKAIYSATKAAMNMLGYTAALEYARQNTSIRSAPFS